MIVLSWNLLSLTRLILFMADISMISPVDAAMAYLEPSTFMQLLNSHHDVFLMVLAQLIKGFLRSCIKLETPDAHLQKEGLSCVIDADFAGTSLGSGVPSSRACSARIS
mmetsp:Transcript_29918/g.68667  ORF Transcript_29918/g.68667 Transcript_29918/m.68667 type:complete len:109 (+) Transcript_29918:28-354(+)